jgi:phosphoserine phosphatase RsbU/P
VLHWSSAGHGPVLVRPAVGLPMQTLDPPVQPLGVLPTWTDRSPAPIPLERTGSLIVVTDGIFEATNAENEQLGIERMCETLDAHQHETPKQLLSNLRESVRTWYAGRDALDDQTIVIVQRGAADDQAVA